ncbi:MAG: tetratricopeptide repeat protein [Rhodothalassiaceae bacterium]
MTCKACLSVLLALLLGGCALHADEPRFSADPDVRGDFASYAMGALALEAKDPAAADYFLAAVDQDPTNTHVLMRAFSATLLEGRYADALGLARDLAATPEPSFVPQMLLVLQDMRRRRWDRANQRLEGIYGSGFDTLISPVLGAWIWAAQDDQARAMARLDALARNPALRSIALTHRGFVLDYLDDHEAAEAAYRRAIESGRLDNFMPVAGLANLLLRTGRQDQAVMLLDEFLEVAPDNPFLLERREAAAKGRRLPLLLDRPVGASAYAFVRIASQFAQRQAVRPALIYARLGSFLRRDYEEATLLTGNLLLESERHGSAIAAFQEIDPDGPSGDTARFLIAYTLQAAGQSEAALEGLQSFVAETGDQAPARAFVTLGDLHRQAEQFDQAIAAYSDALAREDLGRQRWYVLFARAVCFEQTGRWEPAEADFLASIALDDDRAEVLNYLGYSWIDRGVRLDDGIEMIERAAALAPNNGFIIDSLGWAHYLQADYDRAVELLERAILLQPDDPTINNHLGDAYWRVGRQREARFQWDHALNAGADGDLKAALQNKIRFGLGYAEAQPVPSQ